MPKPGQKTITVSEATYSIAEEHAKEENKSVAGYVTDIIVKNSNKKEVVD